MNTASGSNLAYQPVSTTCFKALRNEALKKKTRRKRKAKRKRKEVTLGPQTSQLSILLTSLKKHSVKAALNKVPYSESSRT
jgi:3'-phosphoadenosine 5'-phosphosulfate (PAPS) 3'-phosphatase